MPKELQRPELITISIKIQKPLLDRLDELVKRGVAPNRSEAIRLLLVEALMNYYEVNIGGSQ
ncbi:MAG: ribbon-helix-helix domain-containing protein [Thermocladium sp.]